MTIYSFYIFSFLKFIKPILVQKCIVLLLLSYYVIGFITENRQKYYVLALITLFAATWPHLLCDSLQVANLIYVVPNAAGLTPTDSTSQPQTTEIWAD